MGIKQEFKIDKDSIIKLSKLNRETKKEMHLLFPEIFKKESFIKIGTLFSRRLESGRNLYIIMSNNSDVYIYNITNQNRWKAELKFFDLEDENRKFLTTYEFMYLCGSINPKDLFEVEVLQTNIKLHDKENL